jgi:hypothetical protein
MGAPLGSSPGVSMGAPVRTSTGTSINATTGPSIGAATGPSTDGETTTPGTFRGAESDMASENFGPGAIPPGGPEEPIFGGLGSCPPGQCCEICGGGNCCPHRFYVNQGIRILNRTRARGEALTADLNANAAVAMSTKSASFTLAPGYVLTMGSYLGRDSFDRDDYLEFTYWGLNHFERTVQYNGATLNTLVDAAPATVGSLFSPFPVTVGGFNRVQSHSQTYKSDINNFEWDLRYTPRARPDRLVLQPNGKWRRECQPGRYISYIFGLRYMPIYESYAFRGHGTIDAAGTVRDVSGDYLIFSHNNLLGLQFGADMLWQRCRWNYGVRYKAGPYVNYADQRSQIVTNAAGDPFAGPDLVLRPTATRTEAALIADVGFFGSCKIQPNLIVHVSYDLTWATGLALAPEQLQFQTSPLDRVITSGSMFLQGLSLQLELAW